MATMSVKQRIAIRKSIEAREAAKAAAELAEKKARRNAYFARRGAIAKRAALANA